MSVAFYPWLVNHLWQSTLCAGIAALVVLALRQNSAAVRYRIWFLASVKFLVPFSFFVGLGNQLDWFRPEIPPAAQMTPITVVAGAASPVAPNAASSSLLVESIAVMAPVAAPIKSISNDTPWPQRLLFFAFFIWLCGLAFSLVLWVRQWRRVRARIRTATPLELDVPALIPAMS